MPLLEEHADPRGWNDIRWTVPGKPHRELAHDLASEILGALGSCGTREARSALLRLKRNPGLRDLREEVGIVLRTNDEVMRIGYREYSRRERERYRSGRD